MNKCIIKVTTLFLLVFLESLSAFAGISQLELAVINSNSQKVVEALEYKTTYIGCPYEYEFQRDLICRSYKEERLKINENDINNSIILATILNRFDVVDSLISLGVTPTHIYLNDEGLKLLQDSPYNTSKGFRNFMDRAYMAFVGYRLSYESALVISGNLDRLTKHLVSRGYQGHYVNEHAHNEMDPYYVADLLGNKKAFSLLVKENFPIGEVFPTDEHSPNYMKLIANSCKINRVLVNDNLPTKVETVVIKSIKDQSVTLVDPKACPQDGIYVSSLLMNLVDHHTDTNAFLEYTDYVLAHKIATVEEIVEQMEVRHIKNPNTLIEFLNRHKVELSADNLRGFVSVFSPVENIDVLAEYGVDFNEIISTETRGLADYTVDGGHSLLMYAAYDCQFDKIEKMISHGAKTNTQNQLKRTAIDFLPKPPVDANTWGNIERCEKAKSFLAD